MVRQWRGRGQNALSLLIILSSLQVRIRLSSRPQRHLVLDLTRNPWRGVEGSRGVSFDIPHQGVLPKLAVATPRRQGRIFSTGGFRSLLARSLECRETNGKRDKSWEELPVAAWSGIIARDPSTPRHRFSLRIRFPRRCGRDDSLN